MFCAECKKPCNEIEVDFGYGAYEFWGARGYHTDKRLVSDCCEADTLDELPDDTKEDDDDQEM
jgi:hypothetical protein